MEQKLADAERRLREINRLVYVRTPKEMKAYIHFMRDFDRIRELTAPWYEPPHIRNGEVPQQHQRLSET